MSHSRLISIIMPVYNGEEYIAARLDNLIAFCNNSIELIVINDGSTDRSYTICQEKLSNLPNIKIITQENKGLSEARNTGIKAAEGDYIIFLDSDDILIQDGLTQIVDSLEFCKPDVLMGKLLTIPPNGRIIKPNYTFPDATSASESRVFIYNEVHDCIWHAVRYVCRRDFLLNNSLLFVPGIICEDMEWSPRVLGCANSIVFINAPFYGYYYNRAGSITKSVMFKRILDTNKIVSESIPKYIDEDYGKALAYRLILESFYNISRYCKCSKEQRKVLHPIIINTSELYPYAASGLVKLFIKTKSFIPLYMWSVALFLAREFRGLFKNILGPLRTIRI